MNLGGENVDKQTKREFKKQRKIIYIFLGISIPVMIVLAFLLYYFIPSLKDKQWIVIALIVMFGLILYGGVLFIMNKNEKRKAKKPKPHDPFAD